jgi:hypothetical protein
MGPVPVTYASNDPNPLSPLPDGGGLFIAAPGAPPELTAKTQRTP